MLKIENLSVAYGVVQALYNVDFDVGANEFVALLGSNGAGKTTVLNTISGLSKAISGSISFLGERIEDLSSSERVKAGITQVPEGKRIFPYLTVVENLMMGASGRRETWKKKQDSLEQIFALFPILKERGKVRATLLSGGEQQMLAIGRGLMAHPKLLMIDEPSLGLSPRVLSEIYDIIKDLHKEGTTILLAEQNVEQALSVADRGYVLENGRVMLEGSSKKLLNSEYVRKAYLGV